MLNFFNSFRPRRIVFLRPTPCSKVRSSHTSCMNRTCYFTNWVSNQFRQLYVNIAHDDIFRDWGGSNCEIPKTSTVTIFYGFNILTFNPVLSMLAIVSIFREVSRLEIFFIADDTMQMSPRNSLTRAVIFWALLRISTLCV